MEKEEKPEKKKLTPEEKTAYSECILHGCKLFTSYDACKLCGFNRDEFARRKELPLVKGKGRMYHKNIARKKTKLKGGEKK